MPRPADPTLRDRLIVAATGEFAAQGYSGATLDGIAARAGVTKGGLYFHFAGKEALFFAVLDHWRSERRGELQIAPASPSPAGVAIAKGKTLPRERAADVLRRFLSSYLGFHLRQPEATHLLRVLTTELRGRFTSRLREDERQEQRWLRARLRELLESGVQDGSLAVRDPALAAFVLCGAIGGILQQWHSAPSDVEMHCDEGLLADELIRGHATSSVPEARRPPGDSEFDFGRDRGSR
ncbi:MAG: TetR/AcrR family transcriptional regulator [Planctomycetota bacterium]